MSSRKRQGKSTEKSSKSARGGRSGGEARGNNAAGYELCIDSKPNSGDSNVLYLGPAEMSKSGILNPQKFTGCTIRNTEPDDIRPSALVGIYSALKPGASCKIILNNTILVMQPYEAKMIEANAKLAGFENIVTYEDAQYDENAKRDMDITIITCNRPEVKLSI